MADRDALEEKVAHLERAVLDLSDVVAAQAKEVDRLTRLLNMLAEREAVREAQEMGGYAVADQKPPHY